ncbi:MAG: ABC transporter permease subunit [Bdellovibrionota bacterium]
MAAYFIRRLLLMIPTFLGITLLVFTLTRFVPGGPVERMLSEANAMTREGGGGGGMSSASNIAGTALSEAQINELKEYYGFDKPIVVSYFLWLTKVLSLDLGSSSRYGEPVWDMIKNRFPISTYYGLLSLILTYSICIPLGMVKAVRHNTSVDHVSSILIFIGYAVPGFVFGIFLLVTFAANLDWFPLGGFVSDSFDDFSLWEKIIDVVKHSILPLCAYMLGSFAVMTMTMKNSLLENLAADYVRTAIAKGVPFKKAVLGHAMRNSLIPIVTHIGSNISLILTGSFLIEKIFNIDGFGLLGLESIVERDYPVVMGILAISSLLYLAGNIISDFCVALVDPRIKFD